MLGAVARVVFVAAGPAMILSVVVKVVTVFLAVLDVVAVGLHAVVAETLIDDRSVLVVADVVSFLSVAHAFWLQQLTNETLFPQNWQRIANTLSD